MSALQLAVALTLGAVVGAGALLLVVSLTGLPGTDGEADRPRRPRELRRLGGKVLAGVAVALVTLVVTRWVVLAVVLGGLVMLWDQLFGGAATERTSITRIEGLASWTESLRDTIAGAVGLEQAIPATAVNAAPSIRPALNLLVDRLRVREPLPDALLTFADDLDDPSADLIVAALILNARLRGPGLRDVLGALAESARDELDLRRRVESSRRSTRRSVMIVVGVIVVVAAALTLVNRPYMSAYDTLVGQGVLAVVLTLFALSVLWLRRLAGVEAPQRFLVRSTRSRELSAGGPPGRG